MVKHDNEYHFPPVERLLTDLEAFRLVGELRSDRGTPDQARALMAQFVAAAYTNDGPSRELITFVRDALAEYLDGKSLEAAFRVKRGRRGRPTADARAGIDLAKVMLRHCVVRGSTVEAAALEGAAACHSSPTNAWAAFRDHKTKALQEMRMRTDGPPEVNEAFPEHRDRIIRLFGVAIA
ncbi:hypothetical protein PQQ96_24005 [Paraburkholderia sediminicola]|uniref:hypothetical protein n=1 Tax=Paraburkholderia sediminicola TaxID=458836 RepID=UPI0038BC6428